MTVSPKSVSTAAIGGALLAVVPYLFWHTFLRHVPLTEPNSATIVDRFEPTPSVSPVEISDGQARVRELLPNAATALTLDTATGTLRMYEADTGRAFEVDPSTLRVRTLSDRRLDGFLDTVWSPNGSEVVSSFETRDGSRFRYYDYRSGRTAELPPGTVRVAFSPDGSRLASQRNIEGGSHIWLSRPDGSESMLLLSSRLAVTALAWPRADTVGIVSVRPDGSGDITFIDMDGKLESVYSGGRDLEAVWSRTGDLALISVTVAGAPSLSVLDAGTGALTPLGVRTRASKCAWHRDGSAVTCGVADQPGTVASRESIVTVMLATLETVTRYKPGAGIFLGIQNPVALPGGNGMAFVNVFGQKPNLVNW